MVSSSRNAVRPWQKSVAQIISDRGRELLYQWISAAYIVATALTVLFFIERSELTQDAMLIMWTVALGNRMAKVFAQYRSGGTKA